MRELTPEVRTQLDLVELRRARAVLAHRETIVGRLERARAAPMELDEAREAALVAQCDVEKWSILCGVKL